MTVIKLGSGQEGQSEITSKVDNVEKDVKCVTVVTSNPGPDSVFKLPPPPAGVTTTSSVSSTTVSGIPLLPPPPGPSKSRTTGSNHQVTELFRNRR